MMAGMQMGKVRRFIVFVLMGMGCGVPFTCLVIGACNVAAGPPQGGPDVIERAIFFGFLALLSSVGLGGVAGGLVYAVIYKWLKKPTRTDEDNPYPPI
jgi:hypothetical protein